MAIKSRICRAARETERTGISEIRWAILSHIKRQRQSSIAELARHLRISYEAVRQHGVQLEKEGLIERQSARTRLPSAGRPRQPYTLTPAGDHLFPKHYDGLSVELIDTLRQKLGAAALKQILATLTENRVRQWAPELSGKSLEERIHALRGIYLDGDPFMSVESDDDGLCLIEKNCPFLNVAMHHPALCSVTINTLRRLLGVDVVREERFQTGHGRCVFRIVSQRPIDLARYEFMLEDEAGVA